MPQQMTICLRTFHYTFVFPKSSYAFAFFFGSLLPVDHSYHAFDRHYTTDMAGSSLNLGFLANWYIIFEKNDFRIGVTWMRVGSMESGRLVHGGHFTQRFFFREYTIHQKWSLANAVIENCFGLDRFGSFWNEMHLKQSNKQRPKKKHPGKSTRGVWLGWSWRWYARFPPCLASHMCDCRFQTGCFLSWN